jgi:hypothetical protein
MSEKGFLLYLETNVWCVINFIGEVKIFLDQGGGWPVLKGGKRGNMFCDLI